MAVLVGIYVIQGGAFDVVRDGKAFWVGTWTLYRSPAMNRTDWQFLTGGETSMTFATPALAVAAAEEEGVAFARLLQGDDGLEPMPWEAVPAVETYAPRRTFAGGRC